MGMLDKRPEAKVVDQGGYPLIHADDAPIIQLVGGQLWMTFVEAQPSAHGDQLVITGQVVLKIQAAPNMLLHMGELLANAGMTLVIPKPKLAN